MAIFVENAINHATSL